MVVVKLGGGLGNQMFQYATARAYLRKYEKLVFDTELLQEVSNNVGKRHLRPMAIDIFHHLKNEKIDYDYEKFFRRPSLFRRVVRKLSGNWISYIVQDGMNPYSHKAKRSRHCFLSGNFQSQSVFMRLRNELVFEFEFPKLDFHNSELKNFILDSPEAVSIHIRRGDYLSEINKTTFASVNLDYYFKAIETLKTALQLQTLKVFIFSDDIQWAKQNLLSNSLDSTFVKGNTGLQSWKDMYLMSLCKHHIIANSSFSWWGAWLSTRNGMKTAPKHWFNPNTEAYDINDIVPDEWMIIDYSIN